MQGANGIIYTNSWDPGIYFLSLYNQEGHASHAKIIVQR
jgi:hypothetical protein